MLPAFDDACDLEDEMLLMGFGLDMVPTDHLLHLCSNASVVPVEMNPILLRPTVSK